MPSWNVVYQHQHGEKRDSPRAVAPLKMLGREVAMQVPVSSISPVCRGAGGA